MAQEGLSLRPSDAVAAGVTPVDLNLEVKQAVVTVFDYAGKGPTTTALGLTLVDDNGNEYEQYYSIGPPEKFVPSADGKEVIPTGSVAGITTSCNYYDFMTELINAGFPENKLGSDVSVLEGLYAHFVGKPQRERKGIAGGTMALPVPDKIIRLPWEKGGRTAAKTAPKAGVAVAEEGDAVGELVKLAQEALETADSIERKKLASLVFKNRADHPQKEQMVELIFSDELTTALIEADLKASGTTISK